MNRLLLLAFFWGFVSMGFAKTIRTAADTVYIQRFDTLCQGDTLKIYGRIYTQSGKYRFNIPPKKPTQDTTVIINLWLKPRFQSERFDTLCQGDQLKVGGQSFSSSGTYTIVFPANKLRCDSVVKLNLYVLPIFTQQIQIPLCLGDTMRLGTEEYYYPTLATLHYDARNGCDSIVQYHIHMLDTFRTRLDTVVCQGTKVSVGRDTFLAGKSGTFTYNFASNGLRCDSTIVLQLHVLDTFLTKVQERICQGQSRRLGPSLLSTTGIYRYTFPANTRRCDSTVILDLKILTKQEKLLQQEICEGDTLKIGSEKFFRAGNYRIDLKTAEGCDSSINLNLKINTSIRKILTVSICVGQSYQFGARSLNQSGIYFDTLSSHISGCDSIVRLDLQVEPYEQKTINAAICQGQSYTFDGKALKSPGLYLDTLLSSGICPVILKLQLKVNPVFKDTSRATICQGNVYNIGQMNYTKTGFYSLRLKTAQGCDSIKNLQLTVLPSYRDTMQMAICVGDTFRFGQLKLYQEGAYPIRFNAKNGCDSTLVIKLVHYPIHRDTFPISLCAGDTFRLGRLKYYQTGMYPLTLRDHNSCDSTLYLQVTSHPRYHLNLALMACSGRNIRFGKQILSQSGTYTETFKTMAGCDSVVTLQMNFEPIDTNVTQGGVLLSASIASNIRLYEWLDCASQQVVSRQSSPFFLPPYSGRFAVRMYTDTCMYTSGCHSVQLSTASHDLDFSKQIQYFPNPSSIHLNLHLPATLVGSYHLEWLSSTGKLMHQETRWLDKENSFSTASLPNGLYLLRLQKTTSRDWGVLKFLKID